MRRTDDDNIQTFDAQQLITTGTGLGITQTQMVDEPLRSHLLPRTDSNNGTTGNLAEVSRMRFSNPARPDKSDSKFFSQKISSLASIH